MKNLRVAKNKLKLIIHLNFFLSAFVFGSSKTILSEAIPQKTIENVNKIYLEDESMVKDKCVTITRKKGSLREEIVYGRNKNDCPH